MSAFAWAPLAVHFSIHVSCDCAPHQPPTSQVSAELLAALKSSIVLLAKDVNANHVVQKLLLSFPPSRCDFTFSQVKQQCVEICKERHGCCVMQRCIDAAPPQAKVSVIPSRTGTGIAGRWLGRSGACRPMAALEDTRVAPLEAPCCFGYIQYYRGSACPDRSLWTVGVCRPRSFFVLLLNKAAGAPLNKRRL